jgi:acid phosphatase class B
VKNIVIVDIDGVLIKIDEYSKNIPPDPSDWEEYYKNVEDYPIEEMCALVRNLIPCRRVIFCTGRSDAQRQKTSKLIEDNVAFMASRLLLLMRHDGDHRHDTEVKPELLSEAGINFDDIAFVIEDRNSMVKKWRELGLICMQPFEGDF